VERGCKQRFLVVGEGHEIRWRIDRASIAGGERTGRYLRVLGEQRCGVPNREEKGGQYEALVPAWELSRGPLRGSGASRACT
jgi:hypothetical protein